MYFYIAAITDRNLDPSERNTRFLLVKSPSGDLTEIRSVVKPVIDSFFSADANLSPDLFFLTGNSDQVKFDPNYQFTSKKAALKALRSLTAISEINYGYVKHHKDNTVTVEEVFYAEKSAPDNRAERQAEEKVESDKAAKVETSTDPFNDNKTPNATDAQKLGDKGEPADTTSGADANQAKQVSDVFERANTLDGNPKTQAEANSNLDRTERTARSAPEPLHPPEPLNKSLADSAPKQVPRPNEPSLVREYPPAPNVEPSTTLPIKPVGGLGESRSISASGPITPVSVGQKRINAQRSIFPYGSKLEVTSQILTDSLGNPTGVSFEGRTFNTLDELDVHLANRGLATTASFFNQQVQIEHGMVEDYQVSRPFSPFRGVSATGEVVPLRFVEGVGFIGYHQSTGKIVDVVRNITGEPVRYGTNAGYEYGVNKETGRAARLQLVRDTDGTPMYYEGFDPVTGEKVNVLYERESGAPFKYFGEGATASPLVTPYDPVTGKLNEYGISPSGKPALIQRGADGHVIGAIEHVYDSSTGEYTAQSVQPLVNKEGRTLIYGSTTGQTFDPAKRGQRPGVGETAKTVGELYQSPVFGKVPHRHRTEFGVSHDAHELSKQRIANEEHEAEERRQVAVNENPSLGHAAATEKSNSIDSTVHDEGRAIGQTPYDKQLETMLEEDEGGGVTGDQLHGVAPVPNAEAQRLELQEGYHPDGRPRRVTPGFTVYTRSIEGEDGTLSPHYKRVEMHHRTPSYQDAKRVAKEKGGRVVRIVSPTPVKKEVISVYGEAARGVEGLETLLRRINGQIVLSGENRGNTAFGKIEYTYDSKAANVVAELESVRAEIKSTESYVASFERQLETAIRNRDTYRENELRGWVESARSKLVGLREKEQVLEPKAKLITGAVINYTVHADGGSIRNPGGSVMPVPSDRLGAANEEYAYFKTGMDEKPELYVKLTSSNRAPTYDSNGNITGFKSLEEVHLLPNAEGNYSEHSVEAVTEVKGWRKALPWEKQALVRASGGTLVGFDGTTIVSNEGAFLVGGQTGTEHGQLSLSINPINGDLQNGYEISIHGEGNKIPVFKDGVVTYISEADYIKGILAATPGVNVVSATTSTTTLYDVRYNEIQPTTVSEIDAIKGTPSKPREIGYSGPDFTVGAPEGIPVSRTPEARAQEMAAEKAANQAALERGFEEFRSGRLRPMSPLSDAINAVIDLEESAAGGIRDPRSIAATPPPPPAPPPKTPSSGIPGAPPAPATPTSHASPPPPLPGTPHPVPPPPPTVAPVPPPLTPQPVHPHAVLEANARVFMGSVPGANFLGGHSGRAAVGFAIGAAVGAMAGFNDSTGYGAALATAGAGLIASAAVGAVAENHIGRNVGPAYNRLKGTGYGAIGGLLMAGAMAGAMAAYQHFTGSSFLSNRVNQAAVLMAHDTAEDLAAPQNRNDELVEFTDENGDPLDIDYEGDERDIIEVVDEDDEPIEFDEVPSWGV